MKTASKATVLLSFVTLGLFSASPAQADLKEELREKMHGMEEKARKLKEEGKTEELEKMKQEMREFAQKAKQKHAEQLRAEKMKAEAKDKDKGREKEERGSDEKAELREKEKKDSNEKAKHQEKEKQQAQERAAHERKMMLHREEMERKREGLDKKDPEVAEARMNHLKQAAEHLRAAGRPELAQQILQEGLDNHRKHQADHKPAKEDRSAPLSPELAQRIGSQFAEMHEALRHLNQRLERLEKASKE